MKTEIDIYMADFCYKTSSGLSKDSLPLGIGTIASYCLGQTKDTHELNFRLFITLEELLEAIEEKKPQIVGLANFEWSENLTSAASRKLRRDYPDIILVTGGANISPHSLKMDQIRKKYEDNKKRIVLESELYAQDQDTSLLEKFRDVDFFVHGEGEIPFYNLLMAYRDVSGDKEKLKRLDIPGCSKIVEGEIVWSSPTEDIRDLDIIESPYRVGLYDELLSKYDLIPQVETNRGCPYLCTYCTVGSWAGKVRKHSIEYVKDELMLLNRIAKNRVVRFADSNFGIIPQDIEIAKIINELRREYNYPVGIRLYTAESGSNQRIKEVMKYFSDLIPLNLSYQTMSKEVLNNIKRNNRKDDEIEDMRKFAVQNDMMMSTELILGLPGETIKSFTDGFELMIKSGFESVMVNPLILIRGSDLDTPDSIEKWDYKLKYSLIANNVCKIDDEIIFEYSKLPVSSNSFSEDEYFDMLSFSYFMFVTYRGGWFKELFLFLCENGCSIKDVFDEIKGKSETYPLYNEVLEKILEKVRECYFDDVEELKISLEEKFGNGGVTSLQSYNNVYNYRTQIYICTEKLLSEEFKKENINEISSAIKKVVKARYQKENLELGLDFYEALSTLEKYTLSKIVSPLTLFEETEFVELDYDVPRWAANYSTGTKLVEYKNSSEVTYEMRVRNIQQHTELSNVTHVKSKPRRIVNYFETVVGSNMSRYSPISEFNWNKHMSPLLNVRQL